MSALSVLLTTEGTYPYHKGGVSTWCDALTRQLSEFDFTLFALTMHPCVRPSYALQPNVRQLITVPLWGIEQPGEFRHERPFSTTLEQQWRTTDHAIESRFAPAFDQLLQSVMDRSGPAEQDVAALVALYDYFQEFDYDRTLRSRRVWRSTDVLLRRIAWRDQSGVAPSTAETVAAVRLLYHLLQPLMVPLPRCDVVHSSAAAFCGLPCIVAKFKFGCPFLLTEHGVYVREQYLALRRSIKSPRVRQFMCGLVNLVASLNYHSADMVSPVCAYNARWEEWWGVPTDRIRIIFNGADPDRYSPGQPPASTRPVVCTIGLIYPLKGQLDLIAAAALVRDRIPDVEFRLYGAASDKEYYDACRQSVADKRLERTVVFAGQTTTPWTAFREADVVAMASVSEAFPYSIIEAMLTGAAVVATDVGGVREAIADTGVIVPPRQPQELADAIVALLRHPEQRRQLGTAARSRALQYFTEQKFATSYRAAYQDLLSGSLPHLARAS